MDKELLFFFTSLLFVFIYRLILSISLLRNKRYVIDEKFYVSFFYITLVGAITLLLKNLTVGIILFALTPFVLTFYVAFCPKRIYWIINGYELTDATFNNSFVKIKEEYKDISYTLQRVQLLHKRKEHRIKVEITCKQYEEKEAILNQIIQVCKDKGSKPNPYEWIRVGILSFTILLCLLAILLILFL